MHTYAHVHTNIRHIHTYGHTYAHTHTSIHTRECTQGEPGSVPAWPDYDNIALLTGFGADALATMERNVQVWCAGDTSMCACSHLCHDGAQRTGVVCGGHQHVCSHLRHDGVQRTGVVCGGHQHLCVLTFATLACIRACVWLAKAGGVRYGASHGPAVGGSGGTNWLVCVCAFTFATLACIRACVM